MMKLSRRDHAALRLAIAVFRAESPSGVGRSMHSLRTNTWKRSKFAPVSRKAMLEFEAVASVSVRSF